MAGVYDLGLSSADYRPWDGPPKRTLLVCTQMRSGSTLLGEAIYFAGGLGCPLEYFHGGFRPKFEQRWAVKEIGAYAEKLHRFRTDASGVFSAKLFWQDVVGLVRESAPAEFDSLDGANASETGESAYRRIFSAIADIFPSPTCVFLTRADEIRQAISTFVAMESHAWRNFSSRRDAPRVDYSFDAVVQRLAEIQNDNRHWRNFFRANALPYHAMIYEDLAGNYQATLAQFFKALGRADAPIAPPRLHKQAGTVSEEFLQRFLADFQRRARGG